MPELKLARLPDRTPVRMTITLPPELNRALGQYAALYREAYGQAESVAELVPFMLAAFLESDKAFARARRELPAEQPQPRRRGRRPEPNPVSPSALEDRS